MSKGTKASDRRSWSPVETPGCHVNACPLRAPYCTQHRNRLRLTVYAARKAAETFRAEVTVLRVGRKWGYAKRKGGYRDEIKFDLEAGCEDGRGFSPAHRVLTPEMDADEKRRDAALSAMKAHDLTFLYGGARKVSTEALAGIVELLSAEAAR